MKLKFQKVKTTHHILDDFHTFLGIIEKIPEIQRIIPGRIVREQSGRSGLRINFSYATSSGLKYKICKGSTAQEIFIITTKDSEQYVETVVEKFIKQYIA